MALRHVVLFGFADAVGIEARDEIVRRFSALPEAIPGIDAFEWGHWGQSGHFAGE